MKMQAGGYLQIFIVINFYAINPRFRVYLPQTNQCFFQVSKFLSVKKSPITICLAREVGASGKMEKRFFNMIQGVEVRSNHRGVRVVSAVEPPIGY